MPCLVSTDAVIGNHSRKDAQEKPPGQKVPRPGVAHPAIVYCILNLLGRFRNREVDHLFAYIDVRLPRCVFRLPRPPSRSWGKS